MSGPSKSLILVVDDDRDTAAAISTALTREGFRVQMAYDAIHGRAMIERLNPDLVILDRRLPDADGLELCQELRLNPKFRSLPVLFLSVKGSVPEKIVGLKMGGDDYLPKPFSNEELVARVEALLRRAKPPQSDGAKLKSGDIEMDLDVRKATLKGGPMELGPKEFDLLQAFLESHGRVCSREFLMEKVWGYGRGLNAESRVIDATVCTLRAKLGPAGKRLVSVKNQGYRLEDPA